MSTRVEELASRFEQANEELIATVQGCSGAQWSTQCGSDERSIGVVADHVANSHIPVAQWIQSIAVGQPMAVSMEAIHEANAQHAVARASVTRDDVATTLRDNARQAAEIVRGLNDADIERPVPIAIMGGQEKTAAEMMEMLLIGHVSGHTSDIRSATAS